MLNILINKLGDPNRKARGVLEYPHDVLPIATPARRILQHSSAPVSLSHLTLSRLLPSLALHPPTHTQTASNSAFYLQRLLGDHPAMKGVVVRDVGHFAFRPRIGLRAQYTAVIFLTQITLSHKGKDPEVALAMVELYFDLFRVLLAAGPQAEGGAGDASFKGKGVQGGAKANRKGRHDTAGRLANKKRAAAAAAEEAGAERKAVSPSALSVDSRLLSALLTGINRAFPYVDPDKVDALVERVSPHVFRIAHAQSLHGAVQALTLLFQMMSARSASSDRFYRALYEVQLVRTRGQHSPGQRADPFAHVTTMSLVSAPVHVLPLCATVGTP